MGVFDKIKRKTEDLTSGAGDWASKTIKNSSEWTSKASKDVAEWSKSTASNIADFASEKYENAGKYSNELKVWTREMPEKIQNYTEDFNVEDFWNKIKEVGKKVGQDMIFMALACFYALMEFFKKKENEEDPIEKPAVTDIKVKAKAQNRTALGVMHAYLALNPSTTLEKLREVFPNDIAPDKGVKEMFESLEKAEETNEKMNLYFSKEKELLNLGDGSKAALCTMWTKASLDRLFEKARLYHIEIERVGMSPNAQGFELEEV